MGDFNWDFAKKDSANFGHIVELENTLALEQIITCPTRISIHTESIIDLIFTNTTNLSESGCVEYTITNHFPTFIVKKRESVKTETMRVYKRSFKNYDKEVFQERLCELDWSTIDCLTDVDVMWRMVLSGIIYEANLLCPFRWINVKQNKVRWYNGSLNTIAQERDRLFQAFRRVRGKMSVFISRRSIKGKNIIERLRNVRKNSLGSV